MREVKRAAAIGAAVFLFGFGPALWAGYQAHNMINEGRMPDREYYDYQVLTIIGLIIASIGIGIATYGLVFESHDNDARKIPKSATVIGAVISALGFGTASWTGLAVQHMAGYIQYEAERESLGPWSIVGFLAGSLGMLLMVFGLASITGAHARKRLRT